MLEVSEHIRIPLRELHFSYSRSSGPGGQNVNKVNSKVTLRWNVRRSRSLPSDVAERLREKYRRRFSEDGELQITSQRYRDQGRNTADCLEKLKAMLLEVATPPKRRRKTKPTAGSKERRLHGKRARGQTKELRKPVRW